MTASEGVCGYPVHAWRTLRPGSGKRVASLGGDGSLEGCRELGSLVDPILTTPHHEVLPALLAGDPEVWCVGEDLTDDGGMQDPDEDGPDMVSRIVSLHVPGPPEQER